jgi:hypothetical protein
MRQTISGLAAALAVFVAGAAPAEACDGGCSPCGYVSPCAPVYVQPYAGYGRLADPEVQYHSAPIAAPQYYYVEQGPTYTGPGDFAPRRVYREEGVYDWRYRHHHYGYHAYRHYPWHHHYWHRYGYHYRPHVLHSYY